jgi:hypothetical protein
LPHAQITPVTHDDVSAIDLFIIEEALTIDCPLEEIAILRSLQQLPDA